MARVYIPSQTWSPVIFPDNNNYKPKAGATVQIKLAGTGTNATHYSAITGGSSSTGTITSNSDGTLPGRWIEEDDYDIVVDGGAAIRVAAVGGLTVKTLSSRSLSGTGSPEAAVTAGPGAIYQQTDGAQAATGNSATWIKETGTGNTGWRKLRTTIPFWIDLFSARSGDGLTLPVGQASYAFATAVTASSKLLVSYLTGRVIEAILQVVWTPNDADNGIRVLSMDSATGGVPDNPSTIKDNTGSATATPIANADFVTTEIAAIWDGSASRYLAWQFKSDAAVAPVLYSVNIMVTVEV